MWSSYEILGAPSWVNTERYDIEAKVAEPDVPAWQNQGPEEKMLQAMLQTMLKERCGLTVHHTIVEVPGYALVAGKHGPNWKELKVAKLGEPLPKHAVRLPGGAVIVPFVRSELRPGEAPKVLFLQTSMESFAAELSGRGWADRPVVDKTGLTGTYDFVLVRKDTGSPRGEEGELLPPDPTTRSGWDGVEELGLKLVPTKVPTSALVIDHIEEPSSN